MWTHIVARDISAASVETMWCKTARVLIEILIVLAVPSFIVNIEER
jgi:hypothetical protein